MSYTNLLIIPFYYEFTMVNVYVNFIIGLLGIHGWKLLSCDVY